MPNGQGGNTHFRRTFSILEKQWKIDFTVFGDKDCTRPLFTADIAGQYEILAASECEHDLVKLDGDKLFLGDRFGDLCKKNNFPAKLYPIALIKK